jgi:2-polyprenyl-6-hydroxyphenyl methylase/3-demethylubiquinone-9 3-methyltransferase
MSRDGGSLPAEAGGYILQVYAAEQQDEADVARSGALNVSTRAGAAEEAGANGRSATIDRTELERFAALADEWWNPDGSFRPLHKLNPARLGYIRDRLTQHFSCDAAGAAPLADLSVLDVGCGGGLVCEPLTRLGARVTGIDATERTIGIARSHAAQVGLTIDYRVATIEALLAEGVVFDAVLALEVVEHVPDVRKFVAGCCSLARSGGALVFSTLNRTPRAFVEAIVGAEYVLRWLPRGTHRWDRFVRPSELAFALGEGGARVTDLTGLGYDIVRDGWRTRPDLSVNYLAFAVKD